MKVGDKIVHKKYEGPATIFRSVVETNLDLLTKTTRIKIKYMARQDNSPWTIFEFYGYEIGKTIFKYDPNNQMSFLDSINTNSN